MPLHLLDSTEDLDSNELKGELRIASAIATATMGRLGRQSLATLNDPLLTMDRESNVGIEPGASLRAQDC